MKNIFILLTFLCLTSCNSDENNDLCYDDIYSYTFTIGALDVDTSDFGYYVIEGGPFPVFKYRHEVPQCDYQRDAAWYEDIVFEIQTESLILELKDEELTNIKCYYYRSTAWDYQFKPINSGSFLAHLLNDNEWEITAQLNVLLNSGETHTISIDEIFRKG